jgi:rhamnose transport system permease protein
MSSSSAPSLLLRTRALPIALVLAVLVLVMAALEPRFLGAQGVRSILLWTPLFVLGAMGQMMVILARGIDVSAGAILGLAGMLVAILLRDHPELGIGLAALLALALGAALGAVNGLLVTLGRVPPIVATLGTLGIFRGLTYWVSDGRQVDDYQLPRALGRWSIDGPFGQQVAPWVFWLALAVAAATFLFLRFTRTGRHIYAVGGNPEAAAVRGLPVARTRWLVFVLSGALCGLAGLLYASRFGTVNPANVGDRFELVVIAAAVLGGTSVQGGAGSVPGVLCGCLLLGALSSALTVLRIEATWQAAVYGAVILLAVLLDELIRRRLARAPRSA